MTECKTLRPDNRFTFACPIFNSTVELRTCFRLHEHQMRGDAVEVRQGCQAAMASSKCPVWSMHQMLRNGRDDWFATDTTVRQLGEDVIARIERTQTQDMHTKRYLVGARESELLEEANGMYMRRLAKTPKSKAAKVERQAPALGEVPESAPRPKSSPADALLTAASSGDLSAAITAAAGAQNLTGSSDAPKAKQTRSAVTARAA